VALAATTTIMVALAFLIPLAVLVRTLARDRARPLPNNLPMAAAGAGLLWLGWNGFNGGDSYYAGANASAAVVNTNLCTAVAVLVWIAWDYIFRDKPSMIGSVNGMITGLVAITPGAGFVNGYGAIAIGVIASTLVWMAIRFLSRAPLFRSVDDTLGVIYTHGVAGLTGGLLVGVLLDPNMVLYIGQQGTGNLPGLSSAIHGHWTLLRWQAETAGWVIGYTAIATFVILKVIGIFLPLRLSDEELEIGDHAIHGNEVYPSDVPTLGGPHAPPTWQPSPAPAGTVRPRTYSDRGDGGGDERAMRMRTRGAERGAVRLFRLRHDVLPRVHHSPGVGDVLPPLRGNTAGDRGRPRGHAVRAALSIWREGSP